MHANLFLLINSELMTKSTVVITEQIHKTTSNYLQSLPHTARKDRLQDSYTVDKAVANLHSHSV